MIKFYKVPIVGTGIFNFDPSLDDSYRPKTFDIRKANPTRPFSTIRCAIKTNGVPLKSWALVVIRGNDLSDIDADATCVDLLAGLDVDVSFSALKSRLKTKTLGSLTVNQRNTVKSIAQACDVDPTPFTGTNTLWDVLVAIWNTQDGNIDDPALDAAQ